jgi:hypothetical protein
VEIEISVLDRWRDGFALQELQEGKQMVWERSKICEVK